ncbi:winged helix DNA-binding protein [Sphingomonas sp. GC_Shp_2]|nr:winged helix DNA-binding protein [Sphingomonas sp. GC_Shp_2]
MAPAPRRPTPSAAPRRSVSDGIIDVAQRAYALNERRTALMGEGLFGDPAWNIMLDLFLSECEGRPLCVTSVCVGARASSATALRYIALLRARGLLDRIADTVDKRRTYVRLTDRGWNAMVDLLDGERGAEAERSGRRGRAAR